MHTSGRPPAIVIGLDSITGLQAARVLARHGIDVIGVARERRHPACRTRACTRIVEADTSGDELVDHLRALAAACGDRPVLFPCTDLSVLLLSRDRDRLAETCRTVLPPPGVLELLADKARFHELAVERGWPVPPARVLRDRDDVVRAAAVLAFPCLVKPALKTPQWQAHTSAKLFRVGSPAELLACYERCRTWTDVLVAQQWIDGPDTAHVTCNAYFDAHSRPVLTFVSQKLRQWPLEGGIGCLSQECRNDAVIAETVRVFGSVGHRGLAYLEMKQDGQSGALLIVEPNVGRPTGRSAAADGTGVELLYAQYCDAIGWPLPDAGRQQYGAAKWIHLRRDVQSAAAHWRRGELTLAGWARSLRGCRHDALFSWRDPRPFFADLAWAAAKAWRDAALRSAGRSLAATEATPAPAPAPVAASRITAGSGRENVDYDLHGIVGIRLIEPPAGERAGVDRQFGTLRAPLTREPDIEIRFVEELPLEGLRWVEHGRTGFTEDAFFVFRLGREPVRVQMPFGDVGGRCEIVCARGGRLAPLLMPLANLTARARGYLPLHAAAVVHEGRGVLLPAWATGGKTTGMLALAIGGATYVADEWVWLAADGRRMYGFSGPTELRDWHLSALAAAGLVAPPVRRTMAGAIRRAAAGRRAGTRLGGAGLVDRGIAAVRSRLGVQLDLRRLFPHESAPLAPPQTVFVMMRHEHSDVRVEPADPRLVAERLAHAACHEQWPLVAPYLAFRFAFPDRANEFLTRVLLPPTDSIARALADTTGYLVRHPEVCDLDELFEAMVPASSIEPLAARSGRESGHCATGVSDVPPGSQRALRSV